MSTQLNPLLNLYDGLMTVVYDADEEGLTAILQVVRRVDDRISDRLAAIEANKPKKPGPKPGTKRNVVSKCDDQAYDPTVPANGDTD